MLLPWSLVELTITSEHITDAGLRHLSGLTGLRKLHLPVSRSISDEGLAALAALENLEILSLEAAEGIGDTGMKHLSGMTRLYALSLGAGFATDEGLAPLAGMKKLRSLYLGSANITDAGLRHLAAGPDYLFYLSLPNARGITAEGVAPWLHEDSPLRYLNLADADGLGDDALSFAAHAPMLQLLNMDSAAGITDTGLESLALPKRSRLGSLFLRSAAVTLEGVKHFKEKRPSTLLRVNEALEKILHEERRAAQTRPPQPRPVDVPADPEP